MSLEYIRKTYGVPAKRGGKIVFCGSAQGVITGSLGKYLRVRFGADKYSVPVHPTWNVEYQP